MLCRLRIFLRSVLSFEKRPLATLWSVHVNGPRPLLVAEVLAKIERAADAPGGGPLQAFVERFDIETYSDFSAK